MNYKGKHIFKTDFGMYQVCGIDRFYTFDTINGARGFITKLLKEGQ